MVFECLRLDPDLFETGEQVLFADQTETLGFSRLAVLFERREKKLHFGALCLPIGIEERGQCRPGQPRLIENELLLRRSGEPTKLATREPCGLGRDLDLG